METIDGLGLIYDCLQRKKCLVCLQKFYRKMESWCRVTQCNVGNTIQYCYVTNVYVKVI